MVNVLILIAILVVVYLLMEFILKVSKVAIIVVIAILLVGFLFLGYKDLADYKDSLPDEQTNDTNTTELPSTDDTAQDAINLNSTETTVTVT